MLTVQHPEDTGKWLGYPSGILYYFQISYFNETNTIQNDKKGDLNLYKNYKYFFPNFWMENLSLLPTVYLSFFSWNDDEKFLKNNLLN